jgi:hypothetical protein
MIAGARGLGEVVSDQWLVVSELRKNEMKNFATEKTEKKRR